VDDLDAGLTEVGAEALRKARRRERAAQAKARRIAELEALARRGEGAWQEVDALIQKSQARRCSFFSICENEKGTRL